MIEDYMDTLLKFWPLFAALAWLFLIYLGSGLYVCRKYTGTWNGLKFLFDYKYWSLSIFNHWYFCSKEKGESTDAFIAEFTTRFLMPRQKGVIIRLHEDQRRLLVGILSQEEFFVANFGTKPYTKSVHKKVCRNWDEYSKRFSDAG